jgi:hypothetical protein
MCGAFTQVALLMNCTAMRYELMCNQYFLKSGLLQQLPFGLLTLYVSAGMHLIPASTAQQAVHVGLQCSSCTSLSMFDWYHAQCTKDSC